MYRMYTLQFSRARRVRSFAYFSLFALSPLKKKKQALATRIRPFLALFSARIDQKAFHGHDLIAFINTQVRAFQTVLVDSLEVGLPHGE